MQLDRFPRLWKWIAGVATGLVAILGIVDHLAEWGVFAWLGRQVSMLVALLQVNLQLVAIGVLAMAILLLFGRIYRLERHSPISFNDNFKSIEALRKRWHYEGGWTIPKRGEIRVTQSPSGGMTRVGQLWTDYSFEFTGVLEHEVIAWIVRAQDLSNYYMIQLTPTQIRPHLRYLDQWIYFQNTDHQLTIQANHPIRVRTEVRNIEIRVFVNGKEIYNNEKLFGTKFIALKDEETSKTLRAVVPAFTTGRVGFRQAGNERARFSKARVRPL